MLRLVGHISLEIWGQPSPADTSANIYLLFSTFTCREAKSIQMEHAETTI